MTVAQDYSQDVINLFSRELAGLIPAYHIKSRPDGSFLVIEFAHPNERIYQMANRINASLSDDHAFKDRISVAARKNKPNNVLEMLETGLLQRELTASLTVDKNTFGDNFLERYMPSVTNLEKQIVVSANHMVYGRRGSGKSSLLAYAMHHLRKQQQEYVWIAMQTYSGRFDKQAIASILSDIFTQAAQRSKNPIEMEAVASELSVLGEQDDDSIVDKRLSRMTPRLRKLLGNIPEYTGGLTIFLDDLHVLDNALQPQLLSVIYSLSRGNKIFIKASGIEQLTNLWDGRTRTGLESPHDVQILKLDHNLTAPDQSKEHIKNILDKHAQHCGLPDIHYIASEEFVNRLVLAAAAVPRDALSLFSQSISRSFLRKQKAVSVTSLNGATAEAVEEKLKDMQSDSSKSDQTGLTKRLEAVKHFCLDVQKSNAFLVKIENAKIEYQNIQKLVALRFVHVLHEGTTPRTAGERFVALMLDYGFYIGIRAAKSITLFPSEPRALAAKDLRKLKILTEKPDAKSPVKQPKKREKKASPPKSNAHPI